MDGVGRRERAVGLLCFGDFWGTSMVGLVERRACVCVFVCVRDSRDRRLVI